MIEQPLVSIVASCYNHSRFIVQCLESIRNQTYKNIELIIIDDYSTDNSVDIIQNWISQNKVNCKLIKHNKNLGICKTFNDALAYCNGEYISIVSTDDIYEIDKTEIQIKQFTNLSDDYGVIYGDCYMIDEKGDVIEDSFFKCCNINEVPNGNIYSRLLGGNFIPPVSTLVRKKCYSIVGLYDEGLCFEDYDMWLRISNKFKFSLYAKKLGYYRIVENSATRRLFSRDYNIYLYNLFTIYLKNIYKLITNDEDRYRAISKLNHIAEEIYKCNDRDSHIYLFKTFLCGKRIRTLLMFLMCLFNFKYDKAINYFMSLYKFKNKVFSITPTNRL